MVHIHTKFIASVYRISNTFINNKIHQWTEKSFAEFARMSCSNEGGGTPDDENRCPARLDHLVSFETLPCREVHEQFIRDSVDILIERAVFGATNRKSKVTEYEDPDVLRKLFDFDLRSSPTTHEALFKLVKDTIHYSVKTGHPYFVNQLFSSIDPYGLVGHWMTDSLNPSVYTYEVSPVFCLMEEVVLKEMRKIIGYKDGVGDGLFCPGGSLANAYALNLARFKFNPDIKVCTDWFFHCLLRYISKK